MTPPGPQSRSDPWSVWTLFSIDPDVAVSMDDCLARFRGLGTSNDDVTGYHPRRPAPADRRRRGTGPEPPDRGTDHRSRERVPPVDEHRPRQRRLHAGGVLPLGDRACLHEQRAARHRRQVERHAGGLGRLQDAHRRQPTGQPKEVQRHRRRRVAQRQRRRRGRAGLDLRAHRADPPGLRLGGRVGADRDRRRRGAGPGRQPAAQDGRPGALRLAPPSGRQLLVRHLLAGRGGRSATRPDRVRSAISG